ncbi:OmpA family protein [Gracilinema caldarium]|uniref:OmpA family protein n=1 Tax=Gracilinema caldarium TaxID=215591 RepID=UPI0026EEE5FA|nr:OmpA family protein [Gracilinema caldarium]
MKKERLSFLWGKNIIVFLFILFSWPLFPQNQAGVVLRQTVSGPYILVERSDWARYDNGKYTGHVYRETRYRLDPVQDPAGQRYRGTVYVFEETLRDLQKAARPLDDIIPVDFTLSPSGSMRIADDKGYPQLRNFPLFSDKPLRSGDSWVAHGERIVDPRNDGNRVKLPIVVEYRFLGEESYKGENVFRIQAQYATRYKAVSRSSQTKTPGASQGGSGPFVEASGKHVVDILIRSADGRLVLMRDTLDETFLWPDGSSVRYKGFTLSFSESFLPFDRSAVLAQVTLQLGGDNGQTRRVEKVGGADSVDAGSGGAASGTTSTAAAPASVSAAGEQLRSGGNFELDQGLAGAAPPSAATSGGSAPAAETPSPAASSTPVAPAPAAPSSAAPSVAVVDLPAQNIEVAAVPEGVKLTVRDIRFVADSDEILSSERGRLDIIARALQSVAGAGAVQPLILVEGHTAAVGRPAGEQELSVRRAKKIVDELVARGIPADRFIYKGWGGTKPLADNSTETGRAKNRRVEITILQ